jgi:hypothetical protein
MKLLRSNSVFRNFRKEAMFFKWFERGFESMSFTSLFQRRGPMDENALYHRKYVSRRKRGSTSRTRPGMAEDLSAHWGTWCCTKSLMYWGASLYTDLYIIKISLYSIQALMGSQWRSLSMGEIWARFEVLVIKRAALFWTDWSFAVCSCGMPAKRQLQ